MSFLRAGMGRVGDIGFLGIRGVRGSWDVLTARLGRGIFEALELDRIVGIRKVFRREGMRAKQGLG